MTNSEIATKYGITDADELEYAVAWEADNSIGYPPINHNRKGLTATQVLRQARLCNEESF